MAGKSLAAVMVDKRKTELREFALPEIPTDGGLLRMAVNGICSSGLEHVPEHVPRRAPSLATKWSATSRRSAPPPSTVGA